MAMTVLYFASLREGLGVARETLDQPDGVRVAGDLLAWLRRRGGAWQQLLADGRAVRIAVDQQMVDAAAPLHATAEVAFFPPVTGG